MPINSSSFSKAGRSLPGEEVTGSYPLLAFLDPLELGVSGSLSDMMADGEVGCSDILYGNDNNSEMVTRMRFTRMRFEGSLSCRW